MKKILITLLLICLSFSVFAVSEECKDAYELARASLTAYASLK